MESSKMTEKYRCNYCSRNYRIKTNYDKHVGFCSFINKSKKEQTDILDSLEDIPNPNEMFLFMKELALRVDKLEKENAMLKNAISKEKRKINVLEWLNEKSGIRPDKTFSEWIMDAPIQIIMTSVFENDLVYGILRCFEKRVENQVIPIYACSNKPNTFYIYSDKNEENGDKKYEWVLLSTDLFHKWVDFISQRFLGSFESWVNENKEAIENNEQMNQKYLQYFQKMLGGKLSNEARNNRVRQGVFAKIKHDMRGIVEYEFS